MYMWHIVVTCGAMDGHAICSQYIWLKQWNINMLNDIATFDPFFQLPVLSWKFGIKIHRKLM